MIEFFPFPLLAGGLALIGLAVRRWRQERRWLSLVYLGLFWAYLMVATQLMFFPIRVPPDWPASVTWALPRANLIPFAFGSLFSAMPVVILQELAGNILLTMPFGFGLPFVARVPARRVGWLALGVGLALETTQFVMALVDLPRVYGHSVDINDVLLNALGVVIGYGLFRLLGALRRGRGMLGKVLLE